MWGRGASSPLSPGEEPHINRGPPTIYLHHKRLRIKKKVSKGWCTNCQNLREQQNVYHPQDCTGDVHHGFCGGGARIVGFE